VVGGTIAATDRYLYFILQLQDYLLLASTGERHSCSFVAIRG
jgi:hypothetical protein